MFRKVSGSKAHESNELWKLQTKELHCSLDNPLYNDSLKLVESLAAQKIQGGKLQAKFWLKNFIKRLLRAETAMLKSYVRKRGHGYMKQINSEQNTTFTATRTGTAPTQHYRIWWSVTLTLKSTCIKSVYSSPLTKTQFYFITILKGTKLFLG